MYILSYIILSLIAIIVPSLKIKGDCYYLFSVFILLLLFILAILLSKLKIKIKVTIVLLTLLIYKNTFFCEYFFTINLESKKCSKFIKLFFNRYLNS